ncbi:hypothetical protein DVH24_002247 [Malus domestica]|uniref:Uncharacterized protein n=1 Tax=Malus domestica TaxID=3750 RepID=A0A498I770_MALDO|nr:hypothetical protein DVH24_002247 [Malus domestica]
MSDIVSANEVENPSITSGSRLLSAVMVTVFLRKEKFKYHNLTPSNIETFYDKTPHLTDRLVITKLQTISMLLEVGPPPVSLIVLHDIRAREWACAPM